MHHFAHFHLSLLYELLLCSRTLATRRSTSCGFLAYLEVKNLKMTLYDDIRKGQCLKWDRELLTFFFFLSFLERQKIFHWKKQGEVAFKKMLYCVFKKKSVIWPWDTSILETCLTQCTYSNNVILALLDDFFGGCGKECEARTTDCSF